MKKIQMLPAREQIALEIKNAIMTGEIKAGTELIQEKIADTLGVSRMPVREAFLILERDRFIHFVNGRKAMVSAFSKADIIEHYELRAILEGEAARKAANSIQNTSMLEEWHKSMLKAKNQNEFRSFNKSFHEEIWSMSGGTRIHDLIESLWVHIPPVVMNVSSDYDMKSNQEHELILQAIQANDGETACFQMKDHIIRSMNDYLAHKDMNEKQGADDFDGE